MPYDDPTCAYCPSTVRACRSGEAQTRGPGFCPSKVDPEVQAKARALYDDPETHKLAYTSALVESEGYCRWTRVQEVVEFSKRMGWKKIGIANCIGLIDLANTLTAILESHGFEVISVACKNDNIPKEEIGLSDAQKIRPGNFEPACNPVAQAELLNAHGSEFNVVMGLCIGHDSLFFKYAKAPTTVLVTKDRVLGHNPVAALQLADTYYSQLYGPLKPAQSTKTPPAKRRRSAAPTDSTP
ncbi:conserved protein of unknown function [Rhodovastum atsumiense]|uniref:DUF1847 domain-containing protein n=1 Tax=Rhodovastum atsumiense TaxID=504468 RepID=A0A5M6IK02_9PROT|nr:DUF1847 domain-containing protein [Rhodovastum atsumiense]KAA5608571.1 DUF1847 domain-containing protein [Rhodovastum atsumiense]CAH2598789.1 conserved protein of unknown function [Rhodovastum atsumiense]